jgi:GNAT superfamily N-acetyltransferase
MTMVIDAARASDAAQAARLAAVKREEYEQYSPVFWRVAEGALAIHEPFLARCIEDTASFASFAFREGGELRGIAIAARKVFPPPFRSDPEPSWLVDDFFVSSGELWATVGTALLSAVAAAATDGGATRVIVLSAHRDEPKREMLEAAGYERGASWWVRVLEPQLGDKPELRQTEAITGPAPPVYDPGGTTALALRADDPAEIPAFTRWGAASGAVLGIVPARTSEPELEHALTEAGYEPASDWFVRTL